MIRKRKNSVTVMKQKLLNVNANFLVCISVNSCTENPETKLLRCTVLCGTNNSCPSCMEEKNPNKCFGINRRI